MPNQPLATTRRAIFAIVAALFVLQAVRYAPYLLDDAYISLRYAKNLVEGHGLVFNPGERVEGYTNFLWVILGAGFLAAGIEPMLALKAASALAAGMLLVAVTRLERRVRGGAPEVIPAVAWLLPLEAFGYWATTGLESMLYAAGVVAAFTIGLGEVLDGRRRGAAVAFGVLSLVRPEGVLVFGLASGAYVVVDRLAHGRLRLRPRVADGAIFAAIFVPFFLWRYGYYGEIFPNTAHAKVTGGREQFSNGALNLASWAAAHPLLALAVVAPGLAGIPAVRRRLAAAPGLVGLTLFTLGYVGYLVTIGGDFMPFFRFYLPVAPLAAVALTAFVDPALRLALERRGARFASLAAVALVAIHVLANLPTEQPYRAYVADRTTVVGREVGKHLASVRDPGDLLAVNTAGSMPYYSELETIDQLGLTDATIARTPIYVVSTRWAAHRRGNGAYVLDRRPDVVVWYNAAGAREPHYLGDHQLADLPGFRFFYQLVPIDLLADERGPERGRLLARFLGHPFGESAGERGILAADLASRFETPNRPLPHTRAFSAPIRAQLFQRRADRDALWPAGGAAAIGREAGSLDAFLDRASALWATEAARHAPAPPEVRAKVERQCHRALRAIEVGEIDEAKRVLGEAAALNRVARVPLVYQYVANLAVLEGDLLLAVQAQSEALRLEPTNTLYRRNLRGLLTVPFKTFRDDHRAAGAGPHPAA